MSEQNRAVVRRFQEALQGLQGLKQMMATFGAAFPDIEFTVENVVAEGDKVRTPSPGVVRTRAS